VNICFTSILYILPSILKLVVMASNGANGASNAPNSSEQVKTDIITLTRFLTEEQAKHKEATGDFTSVVALSFYY